MIVSLIVGTVVTVLASLFPALRATRVEPIAAVREGVLPPSRLARFGLPAALVDAGAVARSAALRRRSRAARPAVCACSRSASASILSLHRHGAGRAEVRAAARRRSLGAPGARFGGVSGSLARENAMRNPARTASTAAALMIGLALVTAVGVLAAGLKSTFEHAVDASSSSPTTR